VRSSTLPSGETFEMKPFPSRAAGLPAPTFETRYQSATGSCATDSGASNPEITSDSPEGLGAAMTDEAGMPETSVTRNMQ
jgi:hypothetical protein